MTTPPEPPPPGSMAEAFDQLRESIIGLGRELLDELALPVLAWLDRHHDAMMADVDGPPGECRHFIPLEPLEDGTPRCGLCHPDHPYTEG